MTTLPLPLAWDLSHPCSHLTMCFSLSNLGRIENYSADTGLCVYVQLLHLVLGPTSSLTRPSPCDLRHSSPIIWGLSYITANPRIKSPLGQTWYSLLLSMEVLYWCRIFRTLLLPAHLQFKVASQSFGWDGPKRTCPHLGAGWKSRSADLNSVDFEGFFGGVVVCFLSKQKTLR